ncbi:MAG: exo-alpha-sialidase, partial [Oryzihumus sp.]
DAPADPTTDPAAAASPALAAAAETPSPSTSTPPVAPTGTGTTTFVTTYWRSTDDGATWTQSEGSLVSPFRRDNGWLHPRLVQAADGSLLAPTYGYAENDTRYRSMLARSLDGGATWRIISTIAATPDGSTIREGMSEPSVARLANGDLLAVFRQDSTYAICASSDRAGGGAPLMSARSTDDGLTWSEPQPLVGQGLSVTNTRSVDPQLSAMPGGQLLLTYGRPNTRTLVSEDGTGRSWTDLTVTNPGVTSGYASVVPMGGRRALLVGDNGSNWCFQPDSTATVGIWARTVELRPTDTRRIDLSSRYLDGTLKVSTDLTARPTPAAGVAAALDGSVEAQAGATRPGRSGSYTLDLGAPTALTGASVSLPQARQSAAVDVSTDGRTWRTVAGWVSTGDYRSLTDRSFGAGTTARWVRVRVTSTGAMTTLGEVELRTTASTFEDDVVGYAPQGYVVLPRSAPRVTVVDGGAGLSSDRAVRMHDVSTAETAVLAASAPLATTRSVELGLRPARIASAVLVSLEGRRGTAYQRVVHLGVFPDGSVRRWTGTTWARLSAPGLVRTASWTGFRVVASAAGADVYVNGHRLPRVPLAAGTTGFTGVQLSSGGLGPVGDDVYVDQVRVG